MSFMKKIRCVSAALILLAAVPAVWAAPSPSALASSAIAESTWAAVGIRDIKALCDPSGLLAQYLKMRQSTELLEKNSSFLKDLDIHVGMNSKCEPTTVALRGRAAEGPGRLPDQPGPDQRRFPAERPGGFGPDAAGQPFCGGVRHHLSGEAGS